MGKIKINWKPDRHIEVSLVTQIVQYFKNKISRGHWLVGDQLPSQRALAQAFQVNRSTIVAAISDLIALGILESRVGKGTLVANNSWSFLVGNKSLNWRDYIDKSLHKANRPTVQRINNYEFDDRYIRLSTGEVAAELMPNDAFTEVYGLMAKDKNPLNYIEPLGLLDLRLALCDYLRQWHIHVKPQEILIVSGSLQALQLTSLALLGSKSKVFVEDHSYVKSLKVFDFSGIHMEPMLSDKHGPVPWLIDKAAFKDHTSILYTIPTFNNPTGAMMPTKRREDLLGWCKDQRLPIIEDDVYRELYFDTPPPLPIKSMDTSGNVLYLGSFSKSLAPGLRIGWVVGPEAIVERLGDIKMQTDYGASSVSQWMVTYMLTQGLYADHLLKLRARLKSRCDHVLGLLDKYMSEFSTWQKPRGGFYIWLKLRVNISTEKLFNALLDQGVVINPGFIYGHKDRGHIRLSFSYASMDRMEEGIVILSSTLKTMVDSKTISKECHTNDIL